MLAVAIIGLVVNAIGLTFVGVQLFIGRRQAREEQRKEDLERQRLRREATIRHASSTLEIRNKLRTVLPDDYDAAAILDVIAKALSGDEQLFKSIAMYLGFMENFAVSVSTGTHDLETADSLFGGRLMAIYENYRPYIEAQRTKQNSNYFCRELQWLSSEIKAFRKTRRGYDANGNYIPFAERTTLTK